MSINVSSKLTKLPGVRVDLTVDFRYMSDKQRNGIIFALKHCRFTYQNPITKTFFQATDVPKYVLGYSNPRISLELFDTEEAEEALNLYVTHRLLSDPRGQHPIHTFGGSDLKYLVVHKEDAKMINLYEISILYRHMVKPIIEVAERQGTLTLRLRDDRSEVTE